MLFEIIVLVSVGTAVGFIMAVRKNDDDRSAINTYRRGYNDDDGPKTTSRRLQYATLANHFYDLVTRFYLMGWCRSFHFAPRYRGESFAASIARLEHYVAIRLGLTGGQRVLDIGCGVGGPMTAIARHSHATIIGINNNPAQIKQFQPFENCRMIRGDFMALPDTLGRNFDAAYAFEATCHAPDKIECFRQIYGRLKPGGKFLILEWCVTPAFDSQNPEHRRVTDGIEIGNCLPRLATFAEVETAMTKAGFSVLDAWDVQVESQVPWYSTLQASCTPKGFLMSRAGRSMTWLMCCLLELVGLAPSGTTNVSSLLNSAADDLVRGGELGIFTPSYCVIGQKPLE